MNTDRTPRGAGHALCLLALAGLAWLGGCTSRPAARSTAPSQMVAKTYYLDGAGNLGFGTSSVPRGLRDAGYSGDFEVFLWTVSFNPLVDQRASHLLRARGEELAGQIEAYNREFPGRPVNIIALSAGGGVACWAIENLPANVYVDNLVLLGCSLSHDYDLTRVLERVRGRVLTFYSDGDAILAGVVSAFGTVDGKWGEECIGQVGADLPPGAGAHTRQLYADKVVNNPWLPRYKAYGYSGDHTGATSAKFVASFIAPAILESIGPTAQYANPQVASLPKSTR